MQMLGDGHEVPEMPHLHRPPSLLGRSLIVTIY
jgi:hypothetical protein